MSRSPWSIMLAGALLAGLTVAVYLPATQYGYIWDDGAYVLNNSTLRSGTGLRQIWFQNESALQYYPVAHTAYWIEYQLWGLDPRGYHSVNILLHAAGAIFLWRTLTVLQVGGAWLAAAIFALHPVQVESVVWIAEQKNMLCGLFYFGAVLAYLQYTGLCRHVAEAVEGQAPVESARGFGDIRWYAAALLMFLCALLSKTIACTLPVVLLLLLWWKRTRLTWQDALRLVPFFVLAAILGLVTLSMEKRLDSAGQAWSLSIADRFVLAGRALLFYASTLFWPEQLTFIYPRWEIDAARWQQYAPLFVAVTVVAACGFLRRWIGKGPLVGVLCFVAALGPVLGLFKISFMRYSYVADRWEYLPSVGLIALAIAGAYHATTRFVHTGKSLAPIASAVVLAVLALLTWRQITIYSDEESLWRDTLRKNPEAAVAKMCLGRILQERGRLEESSILYREIVRDGSASDNPAYSDVFMAHNNLGSLLLAQGQIEESIAHCREAARLRPDVAEPHFNLGRAMQKQNRFDEAIESYRRALQIRPDFAEVQYYLGSALHVLHRDDEAVSHFRQALQTKPDWVLPLNDLAWIMATRSTGNTEEATEAVGLAERAAELSRYQESAVLDTLATSYAAAGQFDRAVVVAQRALEIALGSGANLQAEAIRQNLQLYGQRRPYREPGSPPVGTTNPSP